MNGFESSVVIDRPVEEVFAFLSNLENDAAWRREWVESRKTSEGPVGVGSTFRLFGKAMGRRFEVDYETTEYAPNQVAAWKSLAGPLPLRFRRSFERAGGGTRVDFRYEVVEPGLLLRLLRPLFVAMGRRQLVGDYPRLLRLMVGRGPAAARR